MLTFRERIIAFLDDTAEEARNFLPLLAAFRFRRKYKTLQVHH